MNLKKTLCAIGMASLASNAMAVGEGFYMGAQVGATNTHNKSHVVYAKHFVNSPLVFPLNIKPKTSGTGERFFLGYKVNPYAAFEFGFTHYNLASFNLPKGYLVPAETPTTRQNGADIDGILSYPFSRFSVYGKLGVAYMRVSLSGSMLPPSKAGSGGTSNNVRPLFGVGVSADLTQRWVADFSATRITAGSNMENFDMIALGISYHFTNEMCGQFLC